VGEGALGEGDHAIEPGLDQEVGGGEGEGQEAVTRVVFTALGREVVARARVAMAALTAVVETADAARAPLSGPLRLGVIPTVGPFLLPRLVPALRAAFPKLRVYLREDTTERLLDRLGSGALDLALLALPCACAGSETTVVARDAFVAALPAGHKLAALEVIPVEALAAEALLLLEDGHCLRDQALQACGFARGQAPAGEGFAATSLHTLVQMVAGGLGVTLLPHMAVAAGIATGTGIELRPLSGVGTHRMLGLAWRPQTPRVAEYRAMAAVIGGVA
jgi:LysR family hydrogen peroxide-inducible transcriptional activator